MLTKITLEQWRMFIAVVEQGGFAQAAEKLFKTQSAVSHAIKKMDSQLSQPLFAISGRKAVLTPFGQALVPKAKKLLAEAQQMESLGKQFHQGSLGEVAIAVDSLYPRAELYQALKTMANEYPALSIRLYETVLSRTRELMEDGKVVLGIASTLATKHIIEPCYTAELVAVAEKYFPLSCREQIDQQELSGFRQIVLQDAGVRSNQNSGWLGAESRTSASQISTVLDLVLAGHGFAWLPKHHINPLLENGRLVRLPLSQGQSRNVQLQMGISPEDKDRPEIIRLTQLLRLTPLQGSN